MQIHKSVLLPKMRHSPNPDFTSSSLFIARCPRYWPPLRSSNLQSPAHPLCIKHSRACAEALVQFYTGSQLLAWPLQYSPSSICIEWFQGKRWRPGAVLCFTAFGLDSANNTPPFKQNVRRKGQFADTEEEEHGCVRWFYSAFLPTTLTIVG